MICMVLAHVSGRKRYNVHGFVHVPWVESVLFQGPDPGEENLIV